MSGYNKVFILNRNNQQFFPVRSIIYQMDCKLYVIDELTKKVLVSIVWIKEVSGLGSHSSKTGSASGSIHLEEEAALGSLAIRKQVRK